MPHTFIGPPHAPVNMNDAPSVRIIESDQGGWDVQLTRANRVVSTEHYTDWHRAERRMRLLLAAETGTVGGT